MNKWDRRYAAEESIFGTEPHDFVRRVRSYLSVAGKVSDSAMGEGRDGMSLVQYRLSAEGVDNSPVTVAKAEKMAALKGVDFVVWVTDITAMRILPGHCAVINSACCYFAELVCSRLARGIVGALVSDGLFIDVFYHPEQVTPERGPKDRTVLTDMVELQTAFDGPEWLIAERCRMGEGREARSIACLLGRRTLLDGVQSCLRAANSFKMLPIRI